MNRFNEYGCLMAYPSTESQKRFIDFEKKFIKEKDLYIDPIDPTYGYESEPHCTILYGFTKDLTLEEVKKIAEIIQSKKIQANLTDISKFQNEKYDVIKFTVHSDDLKKLNSECKKFPHFSKFPNYNAHMTIAYVKKNTPVKLPSSLNIPLTYSKLRYSGMDGKKFDVELL